MNDKKKLNVLISSMSSSFTLTIKLLAVMTEYLAILVSEGKLAVYFIIMRPLNRVVSTSRACKIRSLLKSQIDNTQTMTYVACYKKVLIQAQQQLLSHHVLVSKKKRLIFLSVIQKKAWQQKSYKRIPTIDPSSCFSYITQITFLLLLQLIL